MMFAQQQQINAPETLPVATKQDVYPDPTFCGVADQLLIAPVLSFVPTMIV